MGLRVGWRSIGHWLVLPLLLACWLAGCSGHAKPLTPLHDLHMPGVTQISSIQTLPPRDAGGSPYGGVIDEAVAYIPPPSSSTSNQGSATSFHVVFLRDHEDAYDVASDGSELHHLDVLPICLNHLDVTPDGRWLTCSDGTTLYSYPLAPTASPQPPPRIATADAGVDFSAGLTWAPDGAHFAAQTNLSSACEIGIFSTSAARDRVDLITLLAFPDFASATSGGALCVFAPLAWSPDGAWLAFSAPNFAPSPLYAFSLASVLPDRLPTPPAMRSVTVTPAQLVFLGTNYPWGPISWHKGPGGESVTVVDGSRDSDHRHRGIVDIDLATHRQTTLLQVDEGEIDALSWTRDGQHLVFAHGQPFCGECQFAYTPSHLYVYTPSAADIAAPSVTP